MLKQVLDSFYAGFDFKRGILNDPVEFPHRYTDPMDIETVALIASSFAYGKVELFKSVTESILSRMGQSPAAFLYDFDVRRQRDNFESIYYRLNKGKDICALLYLIHKVLRRKGSVKAAFLRHDYQKSPLLPPKVGGDLVYNMLARFTDYVGEIDTTAVYGANIRPTGLLQLFPSPYKGSACKRLNMFLRWMVRDKDTDFGLWGEVPKNALIIPLDTHIARVGRCLGFTKRKTNDWKTALEITDALKAFDPDDPVKYDFAMCHHGISGYCNPAQGQTKCNDCPFRPHKAGIV
ncbi:MAG: TIGR02757 family protein [Candidatus Magnetobacterium sp. LHC-1]|uniref:TIGR02757 family protein n=1 Tax=Candidatus Magnetobacterium casense TaxID=1455061 RepID=A0ABS6RYN2_9BACT|nr:TIGR02757 family protein [Candidatus Magnetobacterium casensis]MBF0606817.1 TIGR02757 family protein [Nitrospirota bacterium]MBV6341303.1 TIGR02757 family protein [Candidatus Magnetobacterium casensis]